MGSSVLRVAIDARLSGNGSNGGVEQVIIGLASGLSKIAAADEEYLFLMYPDQEQWLRPHISGRCSILHAKVGGAPGQPAGLSIRRRSRLETMIERFPRSFRRRLEILRGPVEVLRLKEYKRYLRVPRSDGAIEEAGVDVMHQTLQAGFTTAVPCIYHPHDLQHRYFPENFSRRETIWRDVTYRSLCEQARMVAVSSNWAKQDVIKQFSLPSDKVRVVPLAPPTAAYGKPTQEDIDATRRKFNLVAPFLIYPAQTWPHKNHVQLLRAVALLLQRGCDVSLICTGRQNDYYQVVDSELRRLRLEGRIKFLGFVSPVELQCCYKLAHAAVIPTKFEAASFPIWEAFAMEVPVACSNVTSLPEQVGDAGLIFDPDDPSAIAAAVERLWRDGKLREQLVERGRVRLQQLSWENTAQAFRAEYRRLRDDQRKTKNSAVPLH